RRGPDFQLAEGTLVLAAERSGNDARSGLIAGHVPDLHRVPAKVAKLLTRTGPDNLDLGGVVATHGGHAPAVAGKRGECRRDPPFIGAFQVTILAEEAVRHVPPPQDAPLAEHQKFPIVRRETQGVDISAFAAK